MVLLSPAVHRTCLPDERNYEQILHVTMKLDLLLLADLSRIRLLEQACKNVTRRPIKRKGLTGHGGTHYRRVSGRSQGSVTTSGTSGSPS